MTAGYSYPQINDIEPSLLKKYFNEGLKPTSQCPITNTFIFLRRHTARQALKVTSEQWPANVSSVWIFEIKKCYLFTTF